MLSPLRITDIQIEERTFAHFTFRLIWSEAPLLLLGALLLGLSAVPGWYIWANLGYVPVVSLLALLGPVPVWTALCYPLGRAATGRIAHVRDTGIAFWHGYGRILWTGLPVLVGLNIWLASLPLLAQDPPLIVIAGITVNFGVTLLLGLVTLFALPVLIMFDLPVVRAWLYGLALALRWPMVSMGNLALAFLLALGARALGMLGWMLLPMVLLPFTVTSALLLMRRGYDREQAAKATGSGRENQTRTRHSV